MFPIFILQHDHHKKDMHNIKDQLKLLELLQGVNCKDAEIAFERKQLLPYAVHWELSQESIKFQTTHLPAILKCTNTFDARMRVKGVLKGVRTCLLNSGINCHCPVEPPEIHRVNLSFSTRPITTTESASVKSVTVSTPSSSSRRAKRDRMCSPARDDTDPVVTPIITKKAKPSSSLPQQAPSTKDGRYKPLNRATLQWLAENNVQDLARVEYLIKKEYYSRTNDPPHLYIKLMPLIYQVK